MKAKKEKNLKQKVEELELERILNILHFTNIDVWIRTMDKRWKGRVKKRDLTSLYKWIKHFSGVVEDLKMRVKKLEENSNSE